MQVAHGPFLCGHSSLSCILPTSLRVPSQLHLLATQILSLLIFRISSSFYRLQKELPPWITRSSARGISRNTTKVTCRQRRRLLYAPSFHGRNSPPRASGLHPSCRNYYRSCSNMACLCTSLRFSAIDKQRATKERITKFRLEHPEGSGVCGEERSRQLRRPYISVAYLCSYSRTRANVRIISKLSENSSQKLRRCHDLTIHELLECSPIHQAQWSVADIQYFESLTERD